MPAPETATTSPATAPAPSGTQYHLRSGDAHAVVTEVGASLRVLRIGARDVVVPYGEAEIMPAMHGAIMLPWPNRLRDGRYTVDGAAYQVPINEPARAVANHGLVAWERFTPLAVAEDRVSLGLDLVPTPGYPFPLRVRVTFTLRPEGLAIELTTTNLGARTAPYGVGFHPWLSPGPDALDAATLRCDARTWIPTDDRLLPTGAVPVPAHLDFREARPMAGVLLDDAFVDAIHTDGRSWIHLTGADGRTAAAWMDESMTCWQMCSGDEVPGAIRAGLAAEPMTCIADAFNSGERLIHLAPGEEHTVRWGLLLL